MLQYILQTIAFQLLFLLVYELFLKKETFFTYNRAYLLLTPILALLLPLLKIPALQAAIPAETLVMLPEVIIGGNSSETVSQNLAATTSEVTPAINWWLLVYAGGLLFSLGFFFNKFRILRQLFAHKPVVKTAEMKIVEVPDSRIACTFYNTIFLGAQLSEKEKEQILSHELVHLKQKHTLDLLFFEVLRIIFWFNPLIYIYQSRISALHEYLADAGVVKNVKKQEYFQQLLNSAFNTEDISFINQFFNHSIIKKRIVMLQKNKSKSTSKFKFLIILPLMLAMLTYVSCSNEGNHMDEASGELEQYSYTLAKSGEMDAKTEKQHEEYEKFLFENQDYVGWGIIDFENEKVNYSVHSKDEPVPDGSVEMKVQKDQGEYIFYMNLPGKGKSSQTNSGTVEIQTSSGGTGDIPFAVIDEVPVFPGCEALESNDARKECMSQNINEFVNQNFNTSLGQELNLTGINRVYVQFKVSKEGVVEIMGVRAKHPKLEEEARRVINMIPAMIPGKQQGKEVGVLYSLPIIFNAGE
ncbi:M56 family metallopeptidase [Salinimicrobium oceani]|uniref:BlaR1 peptidase M56 n=1 Tax=Salinimicrobium oceani TaxID=2722702 RepID=A0ABX1CVN7_9FLAO|nr:M56 family metallopeptidase [Salinimicrobium oceani]NJW52356.1 blaR1 peptidase M56 [Salinimicrobium oceani]